ncbi:MAG: stage III sporulation protein AE [bacterium]|nr:stage III sporulation protein AE [bacterium]
MKRVGILLAVMLLIFVQAGAVFAYGPAVPELSGEPEFNNNVGQIISGEKKLSPAGIINTVKDDLLREIRAGAKEIMLLVIIAAMSGAVTLLADNGMKAGSEAAFFCCFTAMSASALKCFSIALNYGSEVVGALTDFITKLSPLLMMMLIACGKPASAAAFHPVLSSAVYIIGIVVNKVMLPMCVFCAVLSVSGNIGGENKISGICRAAGSVNKWIMSAVVTIFTGISTIYGFNAPSLDALSAKTIKFAAGTLVPVVGGFLSDTLETVVSGSRVMKNAVGTAGIIAICSICLIPVLKIGVLHLMLQIAAAISEPLSDKRISSMLRDCAGAVSGIFALVVMTAVLFIIDLCIILAATNF